MNDKGQGDKVCGGNEFLQCRTPLLYNRCGEKSVSEIIFQDFLRRETDQKNAFAAIKSFFPTVPVFHFFRP